jgi:ATP-dependent Clp protease ATP-binding subunit ClpA
MNFSLNANSSRIRRARYAKSLGKKWLDWTAIFIGATFLLLGTVLLISGSSLGWVALLPFSTVLTFYSWYRGDLANIKTGKYEFNGQILLHEALEPSLLANLKVSGEPSAYDIWKALESTEEHFFLHNRYGVDAPLFDNMLNHQPGSANAVWPLAAQMQQTYSTDGYTNMAVLFALVKSMPNIEQILRTAGLELSDVETSVPWMKDLKEKRELARSKKNFGGIGRDWAYGYTPILRNLGLNISEDIEKHGFFSDTSIHDAVVRQMAQVMGSGNSTVTLVGEEGAGKTTCVHAFAEVLLTDSSMPKSIRYNQVIQLDASTLISNARGPGQLEELVIQIMNEAHRAKNIILFFDEAQAFFGSDTGNVNLAHVLQPVFESGAVRLIFAMNPQHWQRLASSGVAARLTPVNVPPANEENTLAVLRDQVGLIEFRHKIVYTYQALQEAFKLGSRYVTTQAMPGAALNVLEQAATGAQQQLITREVVQQAVGQTYGIKLQTADAGESNNLLNLEEDLRKQVISQDRAITVIANALRRSRSGVGNPDRPIGTFLFLGPTGVGKTELSKALARSYFGDENAMIRVDMNQYVGAEDVNRLITPMQGNELGFLGEVRKKPFSVILLDEIEKAHPSVVNTLLQMLDEGMMRDSDNKAVSFRDAIIIATSNAGADEIRRLIQEGQDLADLESTFVDTLISRGSFAPEFINRFDEVVLFKPLSQDELVQVIDLIIGGINRTLDTQKVQVVLTDPAKRWLVEKGYDAKLGARPMRRMAQRYVENIVAKRLLERSIQPGGSIQLDVPDFEALG